MNIRNKIGNNFCSFLLKLLMIDYCLVDLHFFSVVKLRIPRKVIKNFFFIRLLYCNEADLNWFDLENSIFTFEQSSPTIYVQIFSLHGQIISPGLSCIFLCILVFLCRVEMLSDNLIILTMEISTFCWQQLVFDRRPTNVILASKLRAKVWRCQNSLWGEKTDD